MQVKGQTSRVQIQLRPLPAVAFQTLWPTCSHASYSGVYSYRSHDDPISVQSTGAMNHSLLRNTPKNNSRRRFFVEKIVYKSCSWYSFLKSFNTNIIYTRSPFPIQWNTPRFLWKQCIGLIFKPVFTLELINKYDKMSIMFKNTDKYAASRPGGTLWAVWVEQLESWSILTDRAGQGVWPGLCLPATLGPYGYTCLLSCI